MHKIITCYVAPILAIPFAVLIFSFSLLMLAIGYTTAIADVIAGNNKPRLNQGIGYPTASQPTLWWESTQAVA